MACSKCKDVKALSPDHSGLKYSLIPATSSIEGRYGRIYPLNEPLIPKPHSPRGGWGVTLFLHGQATQITGSTAQEVFVKAKRFFTENQVTFTDLSLWYNLNIQWVERAIEKYQNVSLQSLLTLGTTNY